MTDLRRTIDELAQTFVSKLARAIKEAPLSELAEITNSQQPPKRPRGRPRKHPPLPTTT